MPIYALCWPLGTVIGPMLGGTFSNPADKFPLLDIPLLRQYPYLMPCLVSAAFSAVGATLAYFLLEEVRTVSPSAFRGCYTHECIEIDSPIKEGARTKTTQEGKVLRIGIRSPGRGSTVCPPVICHSVPAVVDPLRFRSLFRFCCV